MKNFYKKKLEHRMTSKTFVPVLKNIKIFHAFPKYKNIPSDKITDRTRCKYNFRCIEYLLHARLWRNGVIACEIYIHGVFIAPPDLSHFIFQLRKKRLNSFHGKHARSFPNFPPLPDFDALFRFHISTWLIGVGNAKFEFSIFEWAFCDCSFIYKMKIAWIGGYCIGQKNLSHFLSATPRVLGHHNRPRIQISHKKEVKMVNSGKRSENRRRGSLNPILTLLSFVK